MKKKRPAGRPQAELRRSVDQDGVVKVELQRGGPTRWIWLLGLFAALGLGGLLLKAWLSAAPPPRAASSAPSRGHAPAPGAPVTPVTLGRGEPTANEGPAPGMAARPAEGAGPADEPDKEEAPQGHEAEAPWGMKQPGEGRTGTDLFPAPGTKRIKQGIIVPDDFPLPEGYVRHYQATDKGQMLQAILMFHPDYKPLNADGSPMPLPEDRVVPPDMAPPGLPIEILQVPKDAYADSEEGAADAAR